MLAAVDGEGGAGDEIGFIGREEHDATGDVLGPAEPSHRNAADDLLQHFLRHRAHHVGVNIARGNGIDGDVVARAFLRQRLGEAVDAGFRRGVVDLAVLPRLAVHRADIDDATELAGAHAVPGQLGQVEAGAEIGVDHRVPGVARELVHGGVTGDAGIVDQDLDPADFGFDLLDRRGALLVIGDVELVAANAGLLGEGLGRSVVAGVAGHHRAAGPLQVFADRSANAALAARHQCYPCHLTSFLPHFDTAWNGGAPYGSLLILELDMHPDLAGQAPCQDAGCRRRGAMHRSFFHFVKGSVHQPSEISLDHHASPDRKTALATKGRIFLVKYKQ
ncbi:protein of unknown function [Rhodovastum atsumiense]|nr:protein of unknown function [Rhodovastum atsumiense]